MEEIRAKKQKNEILLFRGHAKTEYELKPSLFRKGNEKIREMEAEAIRKIEIAHPKELGGMSAFDKLAMLQHYEFPTRLLDFSLNPLVSLFFAANSHEEDNGVVIICKVPKDDMKQFDDSLVQDISELATLRNKKKINEESCGTFEKYDTQHQEITAQKGENDEYNEGKTKSNTQSDNKGIISKKTNIELPVFVEPKLLNSRISAQKGAFLLFGLSDEFPESIKRKEIIIPAVHKKQIISELEQFGIDDSIMFPSFEHFLLYLREKIKRGE